MKINNIQTFGSVYQPDPGKKSVNREELEQKLKSGSDKILISSEAKEAKNADSLTPKRKAEIEYRIQTGFYDQEEVLEKVAEEILKSPEFIQSLKDK